MLKIAVVEDSFFDYKRLRDLIGRFQKEKATEELSVVRYKDGLEFLEKFQGNCDIVLMDIEMPMLSGMDAAKKMRVSDPFIPLIFTTNMARYAIEGYLVDAIGYLLKPINYVDLCNRLSVAIRKTNRDSGQIVLNVKRGKKKICMTDIYYLESRNNDVFYHTSDGVIKVRATLKQAESELSNGCFVRCNNCYSVNLNYVTGINGSTVKVKEEELQISRSKKKQFIDALMLFYGGNIS